MAHPKARLNVLGRELLVTRVTVLGWPVTTAADAQGISRATGLQVGPAVPGRGHGRARRPELPAASFAAGHADRRGRSGSSRPGRAGAGDPIASDRCSASRRRRSRRSCTGRACPGWPTSTGRPGCPSGGIRPAIRASSSTRTTRSSGGSPTAAATALLGPLDRDAPPDRAGSGYDHFEVVVDDRSRRSVVVQVPDESGASAAAALELALAAFEADGIAVERVMTDNAWAYRGREYRRGPRRPPPDPDPALPAADQRQGRAVHRDPRPGVGLRPDVHHQRGPPRCPAELRRLLQSPPPAYRARWPQPRGRCQQRPWGSQLALWDAAQRFRVRNSVYQQHADVSEYAGGRDLKRLVDVGLLEPRGEKRGRYYVASSQLLAGSGPPCEGGRGESWTKPHGSDQINHGKIDGGRLPSAGLHFKAAAGCDEAGDLAPVVESRRASDSPAITRRNSTSRLVQRSGRASSSACTGSIVPC